MSDTHTLLFALLLGMSFSIPPAVVSYLCYRALVRRYEVMRGFMYEDANRAFNRARLGNWREIANARSAQAQDHLEPNHYQKGYARVYGTAYARSTQKGGE